MMTKKRVGKKGAELSVNVIIIAIIAILVLVVLVAIFTGRAQWFVDMLKRTSSVDRCPITKKPPVPSLSECPNGMGRAVSHWNPSTKKLETWYCCSEE